MNDKNFLDIISSAWNNMLNVLFRPQIMSNNWLAISFAAWLTLIYNDFAALLNIGNYLSSISGTNMPAFLNTFTFLAVFIVFLITMSVIFFWIMSQGEFVYLDKLLNKESKIAESWKKYRSSGNSVFLWRVGFFFVYLVAYFALIAITVGLCFNWVAKCIQIKDLTAPTPLAWIGIIFFIAAILFLALISILIYTIFNNLAIPLMYKDKIKAFKAFITVLKLMVSQPAKMIEYLIILLMLQTVYVTACLIVGALTCCILNVVLAIPFIGTVVLLPIITFFRFFNLEYLAMFGEEYNVLKHPEK